MSKRKQRERHFAPYSLSIGLRPKKIPRGKVLWHNHVMHCKGMGHGVNGFRYRAGWLPVSRKEFEECHCGVIPLKHFKVRGLGSGKCVSTETMMRKAWGMTTAQIKAWRKVKAA
jgi:hypothetical protein